MKISKTLDAIILQEVYNRCPDTNLPEFDEAKELVDTFNEELDEKVKALFDKELSAFLAANPSVAKAEKKNEDDTNHRRVAYRNYYDGKTRHNEYYSIFGTDIWNKNRKHLRELNNKRQEAYNEIVMTLELGGTKADLDRLLAELE